MKRPGIRAGALGALVMTAVFFLIRITAGVATPSELFADVSAPYIPVHLFGILIGIAQGYTPLKILGFTSVVAGQFVVGIGAGILLGRIPESRRSVAAAAIVMALFAASVVAFWPVLVTSYTGLPAGPARFATGSSLLVGFTAYAITVLATLRATNVAADTSRRAFLAGGASIAALTAVASSAVLATRTVFSYDGTMYLGPDVVAVTPVSRFYVVTKNTIDPDIDRGLWRLLVGGAVEIPATMSFEELTRRTSILQATTLMCINNAPDGGLMSNAIWRGISLRDLLIAAGPSPDAKRIAMHSADNYIETIPFSKAMEPTTIVAFEMNGESLPPRHGFPLRVIVPGLFGEKNAKWLTEITVETTELEGFYEKQGWGPHYQIPTHARFDAPDFSKPLGAGPIEVRGIGFCGNRGVSKVELSVDDGKSWRVAQFTSDFNMLTWRLWRYVWKPQPGTYRLAVRATDSHGNVQTSSVHGAETQGATGFDRVVAHVV